MRINKKASSLLGLDKTEVEILRALDSKEMLVAELSSVTHIPRTSLYYILPRLSRRGFISCHRKTTKTYWKTMNGGDVYANYMDTLSALSDSKGKNTVRVISNITEIDFYQGNKNVLNVWKQIADLPIQSRFFGIQPEQSIIQAVTRNQIRDVVDFNKRIKDKKLIAEGIVHERGVDTMVRTLSKDEEKSLLESFVGRSADTAKMPDNFLDNTKAEIYLYDDRIALVNWSEEFAVVIKNKDVFKLIKSMFDSTKYLLDKYDQNDKIARKLINLKDR